jgi:lipopolysaccharide biosynthesis glycosyltransferase
VTAVDIGFGFDTEYALHTASTLASLVRHARGRRFRITMLHVGVGDDLKRKIESVAPGNQSAGMSDEWCATLRQSRRLC